MTTRRKRLRKSLLIAAMLVALYAVWTRMGRQPRPYQPAWHLSGSRSDAVQTDSCLLQIVLIQPFMLPEDYASHGNFFTKMEGYFKQAQEEGLFTGNTLVVLPEHMGTWLVVAGEKSSVARAGSFSAAGLIMAASNPVRFLRYFLDAPPGTSRATFALFRMKSATMQTIYHQVFSTLAKQYGVYIAAGSIVLPEVYVEQGIIHTRRKGLLYNQCVFYHPDGEADGQIARQVFGNSPSPEVKSLNIPVFDLPGAKVAMLISADTHLSSVNEFLKNQGVTFTVASSFATVGTHPAPAWLAPAGSTQPANSVLPNSCAVFLRGKIWDVTCAGESFFMKNGERLPVRQDSVEVLITAACY